MQSRKFLKEDGFGNKTVGRVFVRTKSKTPGSLGGFVRGKPLANQQMEGKANV